MAIVYTEVSRNKRNTFCLVTLFLLVVIALGWVFSRALNMSWILPAAVIFAGIQAFASYWWSDKITLAISGAHEVQKKDSPELYRVVENISIAGGASSAQGLCHR